MAETYYEYAKGSTCTAFNTEDAIKVAYFCSSEKKWINRILRFKEDYPDQVEIRYMPDKNDGMLTAVIPKSWLKIYPPAKRVYTEEQKQMMAERMRAMHSRPHETSRADEAEKTDQT